MTEFDSNTFEHDYIVKVLYHLAVDIKNGKSFCNVVDKHAVELTAFMNGMIRQAMKEKK